jgi:hypothetical protein
MADKTLLKQDKILDIRLYLEGELKLGNRFLISSIQKEIEACDYLLDNIESL